ncbi:SRPBCC family protein [Aldersonia kunmingensis]|uniref:SRPBCC family protein n=1 Tax=Aldersonia kunmingensis TaxID=408066 RepID=UPI0008343899|nr:SRPBCC family protein [Aldersonia kunmingensis]
MPQPLEASIDISAAPEQVWAVVSDLERMPEWSPQCTKMKVLGEMREGARTLNLNKDGWKRWPTTARVVRFEPNRAVAFRVVENRMVWSFEIEPTDSGTRLTQRRDVSGGQSAFSRYSIKFALGGETDFETKLLAGMNSSLGKIKAAVEKG